MIADGAIAQNPISAEQTGGATQSYSITWSGGAVAGGTAGQLQNRLASGAGGGIAGGTAGAKRGRAEAGAGGAVAGGTATAKNGRKEQGTAGAVAGGAADTRTLKEYTYQGQGGAIVGGSAGQLQAKLQAGTGGAIAGGSATIVQQYQRKTYSYTGQGGALAGGTAGSLQARTLAGAGGAVAGGSADVTAITPTTGTATSKSAAPSTYAYQAKAGGSTGKPQFEFEWPDYHPAIPPITGTADSRTTAPQARAAAYYRPEIDLTRVTALEQIDVQRAATARTGSTHSKPGHSYTLARGIVTNDEEDLLQAIAAASIEEEINA